MRAVLYFILAFVCAFWPVFCLLGDKRRGLTRAQKVFMLATFCIGLEFAVLAFMSIPAFYGAIWTEVTAAFLAPLAAFLFFIFLRMATTVGGTTAKDWLMLIPVLVFWGIDLGCNIAMGPEQTSQFITKVLNSQDTGYQAGTFFTLRSTVGYWLGHIILLWAYISVLIYGYRRLKIYHAQLENYYSNLKGLASSLDFYVRVFTWIACIIVSLALLSRNIESGPVTPLTFILVIAAIGLVWFLGSYAVGIEYTMSELTEEVRKEEPKIVTKREYVAPMATINASYGKFSQALKVALDEKVYLEPGIELVSLADRLGTNRTYLSNIIHDEYGQSFAEFINSRRIAYAIEFMENTTEQYPIRYIAVKCGYSSLQTFYNNFAKYTGGKTPAQYMKH